MNRESNPAIIKADAEPYAKSLESRRRTLLFKASLFLGAIASAATALPASAAPEKAFSSPSIPYVGFFEQDMMSGNLEEDREIAEQIKEAGGNDVEVRINYTEPSSTDVGEQWNTMCVAAQAAQEQGLSMSLNFQTYQRGGVIGWVPKSLTELKHFNTYVTTYADGLIGAAYTGNDKVAHRCPSLKNPFKRIRMSIGGEPNYDVMFNPQYDSQGNFVAPANAVHLIASTAPALQKEAKRFNAQVDVSMGSFSPAHSPISFVNAMGTVIKNENIKWPKVGVGVNGYWPGDTPATVHPSGSIVGPGDLPAFIQAAQNAFGYKPDLFVDEMGDQPTVPSDKVNLYKSILPDVAWVDEGGQAQEYREALSIYACNGVKEVNIFHLIDDYKGNPWSRDGIIYPAENLDNGSYPAGSSLDALHKTSFTPVKWTLLDARNGNLQCSALKK